MLRSVKVLIRKHAASNVHFAHPGVWKQNHSVQMAIQVSMQMAKLTSSQCVGIQQSWRAKLLSIKSFDPPAMKERWQDPKWTVNRI
jgi:hypothetical protein